MSEQRLTLKGAYRRLFLCALAGLYSGTLLAAGNCQPEDLHETSVEVAWVTDGDTIRLKDGRKVRFIGIDTPEIGRNGKPDQPLAAQAREHLRQQIEQAGMRVTLSLGPEPRDRYRRLLAHVGIQQGDHWHSLNASMIEAGLAVAYSHPPNITMASCYQARERLAREAERGLWSLPRYQAVSAEQLLRHGTGFRIIEAVIDKVDFKRKGVWLRALPLQAYIARRDLDQFDKDWLEGLQGKRVRLRGWIKKDRYKPATRRFMKLRHPSAISLTGRGE